MKQEIVLGKKQITIVLEGAIYVEDTDKIRTAAHKHIEQGCAEIVFDIEKVEYLDSSGLGMFVKIHKLAQDRGGNIKVKGARGIVKEIFQITKVDRVISVE